MSSSGPSVDPRAVDLSVDRDGLTVALADGRRVIVQQAREPGERSDRDRGALLDRAASERTLPRVRLPARAAQADAGQGAL